MTHLEEARDLAKRMRPEDNLDWVNLSVCPWRLERSPNWADPNGDRGERIWRQVLEPFQPATVGEAIDIAGRLKHPFSARRVKDHIAWIATWRGEPGYPFVRVREEKDDGTLQVPQELREQVLPAQRV